MTLNAGTVYVDVKPDTSDMTSPSGGLSAGMKIAGAVAAGAFVASWAAHKVGPFVADSIAEASSISESTSKLKKVFGESAASVLKFSKTTDTALGQSQAAAMESAGVYGNLFRAIGLGEKPAADMSIKLTGLASDLASFNNTDVETAFMALRAGLVGETEPLRKFGVNMNDATLKAQAMKMGLIESTEDALEPAVKAQAAYALILNQTKLAQGDFADTSMGMANQQRILSAQMDSVKAKVGKALIPAYEGILQLVTGSLMPALKGLAKDAGPMLKTFGDGLQGVAALLVKGDFTKQLGKAFNLSEDSSTVATLLRMREAVIAFFTDFRKSIGNVDPGKVFGQIVEAVKTLGPKLKELSDSSGTGLSDTISVFGVVIKFAAKHVDLLAKALPALVAGFILYKTVQAASNVVAVASPALKIADVVASRRLASANLELAAAVRAQSSSTVASTGTTTANTAARSGGILATLRGTAALIAQKVAMVATSAATKAAAAAQWLLNVAMTANPIGLIIAGVIALIAVIVLIVVKVKPVREFLLKVWKVIAAAAVKAWEWIKAGAIKLFGFLRTIVVTYIAIFRLVWGKIIGVVKAVFDKVWGVVKGAWNRIKAVFDGAKAFYGGIFDTALEAAKTAFNAIASVWNSTVGKLSFHAPDWVPGIGGKGWDVPDIPMLAEGGIVTQPTLALIGEAGPEAVVPLGKGGGILGGQTIRIVDSNLGIVMRGVVEDDKRYLEGAGRMHR